MHHRSHDQGGLHQGGGSAYRGLGRPPPGTEKAGGTHPTGMLSCFLDKFKVYSCALKTKYSYKIKSDKMYRQIYLLPTFLVP